MEEMEEEKDIPPTPPTKEQISMKVPVLFIIPYEEAVIMGGWGERAKIHTRERKSHATLCVPGIKLCLQMKPSAFSFM